MQNNWCKNLIQNWCKKDKRLCKKNGVKKDKKLCKKCKKNSVKNIPCDDYPSQSTNNTLA